MPDAWSLPSHAVSSPLLRIAVLISGSGSNLQALIDAIDADPDFGAAIAVVISDRAGVKGLARADAAGIPTEIIRWSDHSDRSAFTNAVCDVADRYQAEAMILAGFMRILSADAIERFPHRILNIHPAILPAFPGAHAVEQALEHAVKVTGVTVHFVDEHVDHGPIVSQEAVNVFPDDDASSLHARLQEVEHRLYPAAVRALAHGRLYIDDRKVRWQSE